MLSYLESLTTTKEKLHTANMHSAPVLQRRFESE
jgi:hypothetical protein